MSTYNIDQNSINWIRDGDPQDQNTFNRPTNSLREEVNKEFQKLSENISLSLPSSVQDSSETRIPSESQVVQQLLNLEAQGGEIDLTGAVTTTGNQTVGGIKTFSSLPRIPTSNPTRNDEVQSKSYVDSILSRLKLGLGITGEKWIGYKIGNLIAERKEGIEYMNNESYPIMVNVLWHDSFGWIDYVAKVGGVKILSLGTGWDVPAYGAWTASFIVPPNTKYQINERCVVNGWQELR